MLYSGFLGEIVGVNPRELKLPGMKWAPSVEALECIPDLACIALPADAAVHSLRELAKRGLKAAIIYSSGFSESNSNGADLEQEIRDIAEDYGVAVCGPNTAGLISMTSGFVGSFTHALADGTPPKGSAMMITQSGAIGGIVLSRLRERGIGVSHWISVGNGAVLDVPEYLMFAAEDPFTEAVVLFLEGVAEGRRFVDALDRCREAAKQVIVFKAGTTDSGARAARSHTGNLAGVDRVYDAVFRKTDALRVDSLRSATDVLQTLEWNPAAQGKRVAIMSVSGAGCTILADSCERRGLELASFASETSLKIAELLPGYSQQQNPVDLTGSALQELSRLEAVIRTVLNDANVDMALLCFATNCSVEIAYSVVRAWDRTKPLAVVSPVYGEDADVMCRALMDQRVPVYSEFDDAVFSLSAMKVQSTPHTQEYGVGSINERTNEENEVHSDADSDGEWLLASEAMELTHSQGIRIPVSARANSPEEAQAYAADIAVPVALKVDHPGVLHKTDLGGVRLSVKANEVAVQCREMAALIESSGTLFEPEGGFMVQEMIPRGAEVVLGFARDAIFGGVLTIGIGGELVEILNEVGLCVLPATIADLEDALKASRLGELLTNYRGPARDVESLLQAALTFQGFCSSNDDVLEAEINPLIVLGDGDGSVAVDARIRLRKR